MKARTRFIRSVIKTAKSEDVRMPWTRGVTREVAVAARRISVAQTKVRTA